MRVFAGGRSVVLTGNVGDLHVGPEGRIVGLEHLVALASASTRRATMYWTPASGTNQLTAPGQTTIRFSGPGAGVDIPQALARILAELQRCNEPVVVLLDWTDASFGQAGEMLAGVPELLSTMACDPVLQRVGHRVVVVDRSGRLSAPLGSLPGMSRLTVPLPDSEERSVFLEFFEKSHRSPHLASITAGETIEMIAAAANGMSLRSILAVMGELHHEGRDLATSELAPFKEAFLLEHTEGTLCPMSATRPISEVAGVHNLKSLLRDHVAHGNSPLRLILAGPAGGGKSTITSAIGHVLGQTVVSMGEIRDSLVGASEQRSRLMIDTLEAMSPVVLSIDEIDQKLSGDDGPTRDSGVTQRLSAMFWEWTGQVGAKHGVSIVGATNRPEALGSRVHSRFIVVPVLLPDLLEALDVMRIAAARLGRTIDVDAAMILLVNATAPLSGRALAQLVSAAANFEDRKIGSKSGHVGADSLGVAMADQLTWAAHSDVELMSLQAIRYTTRRSLLPWVAAAELGVRYQPPTCLQKFIAPSGELDFGGIEARIEELQRHRGR